MLPEMRQGGAGSLSVDNNFFFYHDESSITVYLVDVSDVGEASLLCPLGKKQCEDASPANYILLSETAIFYLKEILTRLIYGGNSRVRTESALRLATLKILDALVDAGSSAAYKLRDDFLTPAPR